MNKYHTRKAYHIMKTQTKVKRKLKIIHNQHDYWNYKYIGSLRKGKIHCSCPLCSKKTKYRGLSHSDLRKADKLDYYDSLDPIK